MHRTVVGIIIVIPLAGLIAYSRIFLGVDLVIAGASWIGLGLGLHNAPAA